MEKTISEHMKKLRDYHRDTYEHSLRVALSCSRLGIANCLDLHEVNLVYHAGAIHDIGKLKVPLELLTKESELTEEERTLIEGHVRQGYLILEGDFFREIRPIMASHHEFGRRPYPRNGLDRRKEKRCGGRRGEKEGDSERRAEDERVSKLGQILAVSDMHDALSMPRAYKDALTKEEVRKILEVEFRGDKKYIEQIINSLFKL